jgi:outer membrane protein
MRSIIAAVATRKWNRNGHISKWSKKNIKNTVKKRISYIYGTMGDAASILYNKYDITKISIKALNDKYKAAAKTEEKVEEKQKLKQKKRKVFL